MTYEPFASLKTATLGNTLSMTAGWGNDPGSGSGAGGRLASRRLYLTSTGKNRSLLSYAYDNDDNITGIADGVNGANSVAYGYDVRGRLAMVEQRRSGQVIYNRTDYMHDANGNRTALERRFTKGQIEPDTTDSYTLTPGTNRLASITTASLTRNLIYDNRGNLNTETRGPAVTATTAYDGHGRLIGYARTSEDSLAHTYNGLDDRIATARTPSGGGNADIRRFVTAPDGRAMGEYGSSASDVRAEFIWLSPEVGDSGVFGGDDGSGGYMPIALATAAPGGGTTLNWVHGDHLGTPIVITDTTGIAIPQPGGYTTPAFPGQSRTLYDLYYNRYRDYDPTTGQYIQADPIGLAGGQSPYGYAMGNPLRYDDPDGLQVRTMPRPPMARLRGPNGRFLPMTPIPGRMSPNYRPGEFFAGPPGFTVTPQDLVRTRNLCPNTGENTFTRYGRQAHNNYRDALGYDYLYNQSLPSGRRPDAIDYNRRIVRELKPDNPRAIRRGERQLQDYLRELREMTGEAWEGIVDVYRAPW